MALGVRRGAAGSSSSSMTSHWILGLPATPCGMYARMSTHGRTQLSMAAIGSLGRLLASRSLGK